MMKNLQIKKRYLLVFSLVAMMSFHSMWAQLTITITRKCSLKEMYFFTDVNNLPIKTRHGIEISAGPNLGNVIVDVIPEKTFSIPLRTGPVRGFLRLYTAHTSERGVGFSHNGTIGKSYRQLWGDMGYSQQVEIYKTDSREFWRDNALTTDRYLVKPYSLPFFWRWGASIDVAISLTLPVGITAAEVTRIKIPGIPELTGTDFTDALPQLKVLVYRNNDDVFEERDFKVAYDPASPPLNLVTGDSVVFKSKSPKFSFEGLPEAWIARTGGESMYYFTESVNPGDYRPFLGFDSQVHGVAVRKYPPGFKIKQPNITYEASTGLYCWYWIAQTTMDANTERYEPELTNEPLKKFSKYKDKSNFGGIPFKIGGNVEVDFQRNNQREGYNMQFLHSWDSDGFDDYKGQKYILGLDPDEIVYVNGRNAEVNATTRPAAILGADVEEWKRIERSEDALSEMVSAYIRNRAITIDNKYVDPSFPYKGKEIFDKYSYVFRGVTLASGMPEKGCNGKPCVMYKPISASGGFDVAVKVPGKGIKFLYENNGNINMNINVIDPQKFMKGNVNDYGFYAGIEGEQWPAEDQKQVPYTLQGIEYLSPLQRSLLSMDYTYENELGQLSTESRKFSSANYEFEKWTEKFDIKGWGYNEITVYYQRKPGATRIPIAGKELMEINLRFSSIPGSKYTDFSPIPLEGVDLKEGRGEGKNWYLRDYSSDVSNHNEDLGDRSYDISKKYTFPVEETTHFSVMDSDPHTFFHYDTEYYVSERFMSKRLMPARLDPESNDIIWYLADSDYKDSDGLPVGQGRLLKYKWDKAGTYRLTANYHGSKYSQEITIVNNPYVFDATSKKGNIDIFQLSNDQISWLNENSGANGGVTIDKNYVVVKASNIFSKYAYVDGPRVKKYNKVDPLDNRFGLENDFNSRFEWTKKDKDNPSGIAVKNMSTLDPRLRWFPTTWIRHYSGALPENIDLKASGLEILKTNTAIDLVLNKYYPKTNPERWQWRLPWTSSTTWNGYRVRNNIKAIYNLVELFNNSYGAFTGKGNDLFTKDIDYRNAVNDALPSFSVQERTKYDFWMELNSNKKIVINPKTTLVNTLSLYVTDDTVEKKANFIAGPPTSAPSVFLKGMDMSGIKNMETEGIRWHVQNTVTDPYKIMADIGANVARFRLWVKPKYADNITPYPYSTLSSVTNEIKRAKSKGLKILLDLHYSDTWADPEKNIKPSDWNALTTTTQLSSKIIEYTLDVLNTLKKDNIFPDYIQIGNETNSNIMMSKPYEDLTLAQIAREIDTPEANLGGNKFKINWQRNADLINAGLSAVKSFNIDNSVFIKTILHIAGPDNAEFWVNQAFDSRSEGRLGTSTVNNDNVDIIGMSYYRGNGDQRQSLSRLKQIIESIKSKWNIETLIVETAFPRTYGSSDNTVNLFGLPDGVNPPSTSAWPKETSDTIQLQWLTSLRETLKITNGAIGFLYWEPFWVGSNLANMKDGKGSNWENMTFFDFVNRKVPDTNELLNGGIDVFCDPCDWNQNRLKTKIVDDKVNVAPVDNTVNTKMVLYPNPTKDGTFYISFGLQNSSPASLTITDMTGKLVYQTLNQLMDKGNHEFQFGKGIVNLPSGLYIVKVVTNEFTEIRKLIVN